MSGACGRRPVSTWISIITYMVVSAWISIITYMVVSTWISIIT